MTTEDGTMSKWTDHQTELDAERDAWAKAHYGVAGWEHLDSTQVMEMVADMGRQ